MTYVSAQKPCQMTQNKCFNVSQKQINKINLKEVLSFQNNQIKVATKSPSIQKTQKIIASK